MRQVSLERVDLESCVSRAPRERLNVTRNGKPVALVVGVGGSNGTGRSGEQRQVLETHPATAQTENHESIRIGAEGGWRSEARVA
jgi:antitoxin (DNA-binding transcriptional repressor) of toxin-antitoxin stability system